MTLEQQAVDALETLILETEEELDRELSDEERESVIEEFLSGLDDDEEEASGEFCMQGTNAGKPGPCPTGIAAKPAGKAASKVTPKPKAAKPVKPANVKLNAATEKVKKINVKITAAKARAKATMDSLKTELKGAKAELAAIKASVPKKISERAKANKEAAKGAAQKLEAYSTKWTNAAVVSGKKAKNNRPDFSGQPTSEQMEAAVTEMIGKASPIEVAKSMGYRPANRKKAIEDIKLAVLSRIGLARRTSV